MSGNASAGEVPADAPIGLTPELFAAAFPFHMVLDWGWRVLRAGATISRVCPDLRPGVNLTDVIRLVRPKLEFTPASVAGNLDRFFLVEYRATRLQLRGQFVLHPERNVFLFLGSPWFQSADELAAFGLGFEDFALHDQVTDNLHIFQSSKLALADAKKLAERLTRQRAELRSANERLQEQSRQNRTLALIASRTSNAVVLTDSAGRIEWVNEAFTRMTEYSLAEVAGRTPGSLLQGHETDPAVVEFMRESLRRGEGFGAELINYTKSGRKYCLALEVQPIRDESGRISNFMALQSDITERKAAEQQLKDTNTLQRGMLEGAGSAIIATDPKGVIHTFNPAAESMLGYSESEMIGKLTPGIWHDAGEVAARARELSVELGRTIPAGFEAFVAKSELGRPDQREWTFIRKDGTRLPVLLSVSTLFDEQGRITGYLGIATDLSERKRNEERLRSTMSELERMNRVMMNREVRVIDLKREINEMCLALGRPAAYGSVADAGPR